ncbi:ADP-ribosylglycohydrolase family protein [Ursidibacter arcticus]
MADSNLYQQAKAILFGVSVADALGVPVEFKSREYLRLYPVTEMKGYGTYNQPEGTWSDDSSMTFCLAESLTNGFNLDDIAQKSVQWMTQAYWTPHNEVFDIGIITRQSLARYIQGIPAQECGGKDVMDNGNGALMRILPLLFEVKDMPLKERFSTICAVSSLTHRHIRSHFACLYYLEFAAELLKQNDKFIAYQNVNERIASFIQEVEISEIEPFKRLVFGDISHLPEDEIQSSGYVIHTLEASIWCLLTTDNYRDAVLKAVNLGLDTDTTAAVTGGLAGLFYGFDAIPTEWVNLLAKKDNIEKLSIRFAEYYMQKV